MTELFLDGSYVRTARKQVCCEGVAESVAARLTLYACGADCLTYRFLQTARICMMATYNGTSRINASIGRRKDVLPTEFS